MLTALINCLVVTGDSEGRILPNSHLLIENGLIKEISSDDPRDIISNAEKVIDLSGQVVFPGFICSHSHLYSSHMRGAPLDIVPPHTFDEILDRVWWPLDEALSVDDAYSTALYSVYMMARSGVTCYADTYSGPNSISNVLDYISKATQEVGIRGLIGFEVTERNTPEEGFAGLEENKRFLEINDPEETLVHGIIPVHAAFTVSDELLKASKKLSDEFNAPLTIHTSEGKVDLDHNLEKYGKRTIERLNDLGFLGERTVLAHCVHVDDNEIALIKKTDSKVVHNPMSNMLNSVGFAPVVKMLNEGILMGLGNDGYILDQYENLRSALILHKVVHRDPRVIQPDDVYRMATINGAKLYGLDKKIGSLEVGKEADLFVVDPSMSPTLVNEQTVMGHLFFGTFSTIDVKMTMVKGKIIFKDGKHTSIDEKKMISISRKTAAETWSIMKTVK